MSAIYIYPSSAEANVIENVILNSDLSDSFEKVKKEGIYQIKIYFSNVLYYVDKENLDSMMASYPIEGSIPVITERNYYSESKDEVHTTNRMTKFEKVYENMPNGRYALFVKFKWNYMHTRSMFYYELIANNEVIGSSVVEPTDENNYHTEMDFAYLDIINNFVSIRLDFWAGDTKRGVAKMKDVKFLLVRE